MITQARYRKAFSVSMFVAAVIAHGSARAKEAPAAATAPPPAVTAGDLAPIKIPTELTPPDDFARRLVATCGSLGNTGAPAATAGAFTQKALAPSVPATDAAKAALSGLRDTCNHITRGLKLTDVDLQNLQAFRANPAAAQQSIADILTTLKVTAQTSPPAMPPVLGVLGSLESNIITGLAQFVYDRAKEEATLYLSQQLTKQLCSGDRILFFSATCVALGKVDPPLSLSALGSFLATAARRDLRQLPDKTLAYEYVKLPADAPREVRDALIAGRLGLAYFRAVGDGRLPMDVARSLHHLPSTTPGADTDSFGVVGRASELLDAVQAQVGWNTIESVDDSRIPFYALGAIFTLEDFFTADKIKFPAPNGDKLAEVIPVVARFLVDTKTLVDQIEHILNVLKTPQVKPDNGDVQVADKPAPADETGAPATVADFMLAAAKMLNRTLQDGVTIGKKLGAIKDEQAVSVAGIADVFEVGEQIVGGQSPSVLVTATVAMLDDISDRLKLPSPIADDLRALIALVTQVAQARSADEVAKVLEAGAAPTSTYATKYRHGVIALGALVGASGGYESVRTSGGEWSRAFTVGAFGPIGLTASEPLLDWFHIGVMLSVINVGSLVSTRFGDDTKMVGGGSAGATPVTVQNDPPLKFANVFSPGLFVTLGLFQSPFILGIGGQVVPQARQLVAADGSMTTSPATAVQGLLTLSLDVPIFKF